MTGRNGRCLHVEQKTSVDGKPKPEHDVRLWVDPEGQVLKQEVDILGGYVQYRTTKEAAKAEGGPVQFDLIAGSVIKVKHMLPNADETRMVRYQLTFKDVDPAQVIPADSRQSLQGRADQELGDSGSEEHGALGRPSRPGRSRCAVSESPMPW